MSAIQLIPYFKLQKAISAWNIAGDFDFSDEVKTCITPPWEPSVAIGRVSHELYSLGDLSANSFKIETPRGFTNIRTFSNDKKARMFCEHTMKGAEDITFVHPVKFSSSINFKFPEVENNVFSLAHYSNIDDMCATEYKEDKCTSEFTSDLSKKKAEDFFFIVKKTEDDANCEVGVIAVTSSGHTEYLDAPTLTKLNCDDYLKSKNISSMSADSGAINAFNSILMQQPADSMTKVQNKYLLGVDGHTQSINLNKNEKNDDKTVSKTVWSVVINTFLGNCSFGSTQGHHRSNEINKIVNFECRGWNPRLNEKSVWKVHAEYHINSHQEDKDSKYEKDQNEMHVNSESHIADVKTFEPEKENISHQPLAGVFVVDEISKSGEHHSDIALENSEWWMSAERLYNKASGNRRWYPFMNRIPTISMGSTRHPSQPDDAAVQHNQISQEISNGVEFATDSDITDKKRKLMSRNVDDSVIMASNPETDFETNPLDISFLEKCMKDLSGKNHEFIFIRRDENGRLQFMSQDTERAHIFHQFELHTNSLRRSSHDLNIMLPIKGSNECYLSDEDVKKIEDKTFRFNLFTSGAMTTVIPTLEKFNNNFKEITENIQTSFKSVKDEFVNDMPTVIGDELQKELVIENTPVQDPTETPNVKVDDALPSVQKIVNQVYEDEQMALKHSINAIFSRLQEESILEDRQSNVNPLKSYQNSLESIPEEERQQLLDL